jgi:uncharacterized protein YbaR (Trm112 family)
MLSEDLRKMLACPQCKGALRYESERDSLVCDRCRLIYAVKDDIPIMVVKEAESF